MKASAKQQARKTQGLSFSSTKVSAFDANDALIDKKLAALTEDAKIDGTSDKVTESAHKDTAHTHAVKQPAAASGVTKAKGSGKELPPAHGMSAKAAENDLDGYFAKQNARIQEEGVPVHAS
jgi:hypothetical protein